MQLFCSWLNASCDLESRMQAASRSHQLFNNLPDQELHRRWRSSLMLSTNSVLTHDVPSNFESRPAAGSSKIAVDDGGTMVLFHHSSQMFIEVAEERDGNNSPAGSPSGGLLPPSPLKYEIMAVTIVLQGLAKMHVQPWRNRITCCIMPKIDCRITCFLCYHRLTEILCPPRRYRITCSIYAKRSVQTHLHNSGPLPEAAYCVQPWNLNWNANGTYCTTAQEHKPSYICLKISFTKLVEFVYDTSFLNRMKVVIDGDVESNPGPTSYASKKLELVNVCLLVIILTFLLSTAYVLAITTLHMMYLHFIYFMPFLMLMITYGYSYFILYHFSELLSTTFQKIAKRDELMRKPPVTKGTKVHTLIPFHYLHTFVLDGRHSTADGRHLTSVHDNEFKIDYKLNKLCHKMVSVSSYIFYILYLLYVTYAMVMISTQSLYPLSYVVFILSNGLITRRLNKSNKSKLLQILLLYFVTVANTKTPKGKGRPKKKKTGFRGRKLDFSQIDDDKHDDNIAHLSFASKKEIIEPTEITTSASEIFLDDDVSISSTATVDTAGIQENNTNERICVSESDSSSLTSTSVIINDNSNNSLLTEKVPVGLRNSGENICFFNSVAQVLYSLLSFRGHIFNTPLDHIVIIKLRQLFREMESSPAYDINTYLLVADLGIPDYNHQRKEQIDAREIFSYLIENCFDSRVVIDQVTHLPKLAPDYGLFNLSERTTMRCKDCGKENVPVNDIVPLISVPVEEFRRQSVNGLLDRLFYEHGYPNEHYICRTEQDTNGNRIEGCGAVGTCNEIKSMTVEGDFLTILLKIFYQDYINGVTCKKLADIDIDQELYRGDTFDLQGIIWHHGTSFNTGHYTCNVKVNGIWYLADDKTIKRNESFRSIPLYGKIPYIVVYKKRTCDIDVDSNRVNNGPSSSRNDKSYAADDINSVEIGSIMKDVTNLATPKKRTLDSLNDDLEEANNAKKTVLEENVDFVVNDTACMEIDEFESIDEPVTKKYNFSKRKAKFTTKEERMKKTAEGRKILAERERLRKDKLRATPQGRKKYNEKQNHLMEKIRATPEGRKEYNEQQNHLMEKIRATPEGRKKYNEQHRCTNEKIYATPKGRTEHNEQEKLRSKAKRSTPKGRKDHNEQEKLRAAKKISELEERMRNMKFPPKFESDDEIESNCINAFIKATSADALKTRECGVCGKAVRKGLFKERSLSEDDKEGIPNIRLLSTEHQENPNCLPEYVHPVDLDAGLTTELLLSPGGVDRDEIVCCNKCFNCLKSNKLPVYSIANNFQIGKTPPELSDLTLPEKLLISKCRPKMYVVKLRSIAGPQAQQKGLKGNTITFPQDVVKMASTLPANPDILADHIRVIFVGKSTPTSDMLKKILTVRRDKVYHALSFLRANNPVYADVVISNQVLANLPTDDVPTQLMQTLETHDDPDDKDADEHSTYTPQTDLDDVPPDTFVMNSVGMVDFQGTTVHSSDQMISAARNLQENNSTGSTNETNDSTGLQGTMIVPHGSVPVNEYNNPSLWYMSYPWLFPYGRGGPEIGRNRELKGIRGYAKHVLQLADKKFSLDVSFKFHIFNIIQKRDVSYHTSMYVRKPGFDATARSIDALNSESLEQVLKCIENKIPITDPNMKKLMDSLSSAGKHINGSPYQKSTYRRQIFGLMTELGTPFLWITLSPAVVHSPIFLRIAGVEFDMSQIPSHLLYYLKLS